MKPKDGIAATYTGAGREALSAKYPRIERGAAGVFTARHKFEIEKDPARPLLFYPKAWGYVYGFAVRQDEVRAAQAVE